MAEEKGTSCVGSNNKRCDTELLMASYVEDNTAHGKGWIFNSDSTIHVYSQKELFYNSLIAKEEGIVKMVDGSACEVIGIGQSRLQGVLWRQSGMSQRHGII